MILKLTNLILLLASTAWLTTNHEWEPFIAFMTLLSTMVIQEFRDRNIGNNEKSVEHDKKLYLIYEEILPEKDFVYLLNNDIWNSRTDNGYVGRISKYLHLADSIEGNFIESKLNKKFNIFIGSLHELRTFFATHFFVPNDGMAKSTEGEYLLYLYPDLKNSNDESKRELYATRLKQLHEVIDKTIKSYKDFRKQIKIEIYI